MIPKLFLNFGEFQPSYSYRLYAYKSAQINIQKKQILCIGYKTLEALVLEARVEHRHCKNSIDQMLQSGKVRFILFS